MPDDPYATQTPEARTRMIRGLCALVRPPLPPARVEHYLASTMTIPEIQRELVEYMAFRDQEIDDAPPRRRDD